MWQKVRIQLSKGVLRLKAHLNRNPQRKGHVVIILTHLSCEYDRKGRRGQMPEELKTKRWENLHRPRPRETPIATECSSHDGASVGKANDSAEQTHSLYSLLRDARLHMYVEWLLRARSCMVA